MSDIRTLHAALRIDAAHPSLPGHFPGHPVVPGVVLLDCIASALEHAGAGRIARMAVVKFLAPLLPEQDADITIHSDGARVDFSVQRGGTMILKGQGELA